MLRDLLSLVLISYLLSLVLCQQGFQLVQGILQHLLVDEVHLKTRLHRQRLTQLALHRQTVRQTDL